MNSMGQILLEKLTVTQSVKLPTFYGTKTCIIMFTTGPQLVNIVSHLNPAHTFTLTTTRSMLNYLSIYAYISHVVSFCPSGLPNKILCGFHIPPM